MVIVVIFLMLGILVMKMVDLMLIIISKCINQMLYFVEALAGYGRMVVIMAMLVMMFRKIIMFVRAIVVLVMVKMG